MLFVRLAVANQHKAHMHKDPVLRILRLVARHSFDDVAGCATWEEKSANEAALEGFGQAKWSH